MSSMSGKQAAAPALLLPATCEQGGPVCKQARDSACSRDGSDDDILV